MTPTMRTMRLTPHAGILGAALLGQVMTDLARAEPEEEKPRIEPQPAMQSRQQRRYAERQARKRQMRG